MTPEEFILSHPFFTTKDFALATKVRIDSAARSLKAYLKIGLLTKITRGVWGYMKHPHFSPYGLVPLLLGPEQGYVSFLSALQRHGVLAQIPQKILVATTGHTRQLNSSIANFDFIQVNPKYMLYGVEWVKTDICYGLASAEKALIDCFYISTRKKKRFASFPELDFAHINKKKFNSLLKRHNFPKPIETKIKILFADLLNQNHGV